jgi:hypothetical protein
MNRARAVNPADIAELIATPAAHIGAPSRPLNPNAALGALLKLILLDMPLKQSILVLLIPGQPKLLTIHAFVPFHFAGGAELFAAGVAVEEGVVWVLYDAVGAVCRRTVEVFLAD